MTTDERPLKPAENPLWAMTKVLALAVGFSAIFLLVMLFRPHEPTGGLAPGEVPPAIKAAGWINGTAPAAEELLGKVVVVDAWATWCGPCRRKAPYLVDLYRTYADKGVVFVGLTDQGDDDLPAIEEFVREAGITWPNGYGAEETLTAFKHLGIPAVWVIGRDGVIVWNSDSSGDVHNGIEQALAK